MIERAFICYGAAGSPDRLLAVGTLAEASAAARRQEACDVLVDCRRLPGLEEPALTFSLDGVPMVSTGVAAFCALRASAGTSLLGTGGETVELAPRTGETLEAVECGIWRQLSGIEGRSLARDMSARSAAFVEARNERLSWLRCHLRTLLDSGEVEPEPARLAIGRITELLRGSRFWV